MDGRLEGAATVSTGGQKRKFFPCRFGVSGQALSRPAPAVMSVPRSLFPTSIGP